MADVSTAKVGRRAMLTAGLAGMIATVAGALGAPRRVVAGDGDDLVIGKIANVGQSTTWLHTTNNDGFHSKTDGGDAVVAESGAANKSGLYGLSTHSSGTGVFGRNNVTGSWGALGKPDKGVHGKSASGEGVLGQSDTANGVVGQSGGAGRSGIYGSSSHATGWGVFGVHTPSGNWGALGRAAGGIHGGSTSGEGVRGQSDKGDGVVGQSNGADKSGVYAFNSNKDGYGAYGENVPAATFGYLGGRQYGVYGRAGGPALAGLMGEHTGQGWGVAGTNKSTKCSGALGGAYGVVAGAEPQRIALAVEGRVMFGLSGVLTVASGKSSATQGGLTGGFLTPATAVHATLQTNRAGVYVQAAVPNESKGTVTIYLNKKVAAATKVAWFIIERGAP